MLELKASTGKVEADIDFIYTIEDEVFPFVRENILKGLTKDKGPSSKPLNHLKYKHKLGEECLICKRYLTPNTKLDSVLSVKIYSEIKMILHEDNVLGGTPSNSMIMSKYVNKFNRELLKFTCQIMGCKLIHGHLIAEDLFEEVNAFLTAHSMTEILKVSMKKSTFEQIVKLILMKYEYSKPQCIGDFHNASELVNHKSNLIILLGGSSGTGKSTLASLVGARFGISTVLSTDSIRHIMRNFMTKEENSLLFCSTYETAKFVTESDTLSEKEKTIKGFKIQCKYIYPHLMKIIDDLIAQNENIVIEGVHLTVDFLMIVMAKYPFCIPFVICIKDKERHKDRFAVRSKRMTLDPRFNRYIERFDYIRTIHKYLMRKAEKRLIPRINNTNVDKSLSIVHAVLIKCLRKFSKGESLLDETKNRATVLFKEFNSVTKSGLSSAEAQKIIKSKVNKGEIFKRFFGEQFESKDKEEILNEEEDKRVHSMDENEMEQTKEQSTEELLPEEISNEETKTEDKTMTFTTVQEKVAVNSKSRIRRIEMLTKNSKSVENLLLKKENVNSEINIRGTYISR